MAVYALLLCAVCFTLRAAADVDFFMTTSTSSVTLECQRRAISVLYVDCVSSAVGGSSEQFPDPTNNGPGQILRAIQGVVNGKQIADLLVFDLGTFPCPNALKIKFDCSREMLGQVEDDTAHLTCAEGYQVDKPKFHCADGRPTRAGKDDFKMLCYGKQTCAAPIPLNLWCGTGNSVDYVVHHCKATGRIIVQLDAVRATQVILDKCSPTQKPFPVHVYCGSSLGVFDNKPNFDLARKRCTFGTPLLSQDDLKDPNDVCTDANNAYLEYACLEQVDFISSDAEKEVACRKEYAFPMFAACEAASEAAAIIQPGVVAAARLIFSGAKDWSVPLANLGEFTCGSFALTLLYKCAPFDTLFVDLTSDEGALVCGRGSVIKLEAMRCDAMDMTSSVSPTSASWDQAYQTCGAEITCGVNLATFANANPCIDTAHPITAIVYKCKKLKSLERDDGFVLYGITELVSIEFPAPSTVHIKDAFCSNGGEPTEFAAGATWDNVMEAIMMLCNGQPYCRLAGSVINSGVWPCAQGEQLVVVAVNSMVMTGLLVSGGALLKMTCGPDLVIAAPSVLCATGFLQPAATDYFDSNCLKQNECTATVDATGWCGTGGEIGDAHYHCQQASGEYMVHLGSGINDLVTLTCPSGLAPVPSTVLCGHVAIADPSGLSSAVLNCATNGGCGVGPNVLFGGLATCPDIYQVYLVYSCMKVAVVPTGPNPISMSCDAGSIYVQNVICQLSGAADSMDVIKTAANGLQSYSVTGDVLGAACTNGHLVIYACEEADVLAEVLEGAGEVVPKCGTGHVVQSVSLECFPSGSRADPAAVQKVMDDCLGKTTCTIRGSLFSPAPLPCETGQTTLVKYNCVPEVPPTESVVAVSGSWLILTCAPHENIGRELTVTCSQGDSEPDMVSVVEGCAVKRGLCYVYLASSLCVDPSAAATIEYKCSEAVEAKTSSALLELFCGAGLLVEVTKLQCLTGAGQPTDAPAASLQLLESACVGDRCSATTDELENPCVGADWIIASYKCKEPKFEIIIETVTVSVTGVATLTCPLGLYVGLKLTLTCTGGDVKPGMLQTLLGQAVAQQTTAGVDLGENPCVVTSVEAVVAYSCVSVLHVEVARVRTAKLQFSCPEDTLVKVVKIKCKKRKERAKDCPCGSEQDKLEKMCGNAGGCAARWTDFAWPCKPGDKVVVEYKCDKPQTPDKCGLTEADTVWNPCSMVCGGCGTSRRRMCDFDRQVIWQWRHCNICPCLRGSDPYEWRRLGRKGKGAHGRRSNYPCCFAFDKHTMKKKDHRGSKKYKSCRRNKVKGWVKTRAADACTVGHAQPNYGPLQYGFKKGMHDKHGK